MPREFSRSRRVAEQLQRSLAQLIQTESKDPRLVGVTVQGVEVSRDLSTAKVFYSLIGDGDRAAVQQGLEKAGGFFRRELGQQLSMRSIPSLRFIYDDTAQRGAALSRLIDEAVASDREKHREDDHGT